LAAASFVSLTRSIASAVGAGIPAHVVPNVSLAEVVEGFRVTEMRSRFDIMEIVQEVQAKIFVLRNVDPREIGIAG
jgi:hypothetical protein